MPALKTLKRQHERKDIDGPGAPHLRPLRLAKSQHKPNKFDLDENTILLKKLLKERKQELSKFLDSHSAIHSSQQFESTKVWATEKKTKKERKAQRGIQIRCLSKSSSQSSSSQQSDCSGKRGATGTSEPKSRRVCPKVEILETEISPKAQNGLNLTCIETMNSCENPNTLIPNKQETQQLMINNQLSPLKHTTKYDFRIRSSASIHARTPKLSSPNKLERPASSVYRRNMECYQNQLRSMSRGSSNSSQQRLDKFKENEHHVTVQVDQLRSRVEKINGFQPMGLTTGRDFCRHAERRISPSCSS